MQNFLKINHTVNYGETDTEYRLRFDSVLSLFQTATLFHSKEIKVDAPTLVEKSNAFWVLTKSKFKIISMPVMNDVITVETWPLPITPVRFNREYVISANQVNCVLGSSEWVTLDYTTRTLRKSSTIAYPTELVHRTDLSGAGEFTRTRENISEENLSHVHVSRYVDIDPNSHTNNVAYVRMALNAFSPEEFLKANFKEFEIHFDTQSYYGDEIKIYKLKTDYGYYIEGKVNNKTTFKCYFRW